MCSTGWFLFVCLSATFWSGFFCCEDMKSQVHPRVMVAEERFIASPVPCEEAWDSFLSVNRSHSYACIARVSLCSSDEDSACWMFSNIPPLHNVRTIDLKLIVLPWESVIPVGGVNMMLYPSVASEGCKQGELFPTGAFCHFSIPAACSDCFLWLESKLCVKPAWSIGSPLNLSVLLLLISVLVCLGLSRKQGWAFSRNCHMTSSKC